MGGLAWPALTWAAVGLGILFFVTTLPFVAGAWKQDRAVAVISPLLLLLRALALGSGIVAGIANYLAAKAAGLTRRQVAEHRRDAHTAEQDTEC